MNITELRRGFAEKQCRYDAEGYFLTPTDRKRYMTSIRLSLGQVIPDDDIRRRVMGWLFGLDGQISTSDLTDSQIKIMRKWLQTLPVGNDWTINRTAQDEINHIILALGLTSMLQAAVELGGVITQDGDDPEYEPPIAYFVFD